MGIASLGGGGGSGSKPSPTVIGDVVVGSDADDLRVAPVEVRFRLTDVESNATSVELAYLPPGGGAPVPLLLTGAITNLQGLASSPGGVEHARQWDFASQLPSGTSYASGYVVVASVSATSASAPSPTVALGDDPPAVGGVVAPAGELVGVIPIDLVVSDSSSDLVDVLVEYDNLDDAAGWQPTTALGPDLGAVASSPAGTPVTYLWNVPLDEPGLEFDAMLRFTPDDGTYAGSPVTTGTLSIDNNDAPLAIVNGGGFLATPDARRGLPLALQVVDAESDEVRVVVQWRGPFGTFPALPADASGLNAILGDPLLRRQYQIATSFEAAAAGIAEPAGPTGARLSELAHGETGLASPDVVGRRLQIMRSGAVPIPSAGSWASNPLVGPTDALSFEDGDSVLVLDRPTGGSWRLRELETATGTVLRDVATGAGDPNRLAPALLDGRVLVASDVGGTWSVAEVDLGTGTTAPWLTASGATELGAVRGLAATGTTSALITVGSSLVQIDVGDPFAPVEVAVLTGLAGPHGVVRAPHRADLVYLAERDWVDPATMLPTGRIASVDLAKQELTTIPAGVSVVHPEAIALARSDTRLVIVTDAVPADGMHELRAVDLGSNGSFELAASLPDSVGAVACGPGDLLVVALTSTDDLAIGGGIQQVRTITASDPATSTVQVDAAFAPPLVQLQRWRIVDELDRVPATPTGVGRIFVWDSSDLVKSGEVVLRAVPFDSEQGVATDTGVPRPIRFGIDVAPISVGANALGGVRSVRSVDTNGDGRLDLVSANADLDEVTVFYQTSTGTFPAAPDLTLTGIPILAPMNEPIDVQVLDVDTDGDLDVVTANRAGNSFSVFLQLVPGSFTPQLLTLGTGLNQPASLAAGDLNEDGTSDLAIASEGSNSVLLFFQQVGGLFSPGPSITLGDATTLAPRSVALGDLDGDGDLDLLVACSGNDRVVGFLQGAPGVFPAAPSFSVGDPTLTSAPSSVACADIDRDGRLDFACANTGSSSLAVFLQDAMGGFSTLPTYVLASSTGPLQPASLVLADLNDDRLLDVASANGGDDLSVFFQDPETGGFAAQEVAIEGAGGLIDPSRMVATDLDANGLVDLVVANTGVDQIECFLQRAPGYFSDLAPDLNVGNAVETLGPAGVALGDLDGDGDLDLASANELGNSVTVYTQFSPAVVGTVPRWVLGSAVETAGPRDVIAADLDADGRLDLATANGAGGDLAIFFQNAGGSFSVTPDLRLGAAALGAPAALAADDLDGDGDLDLISANAGGNDVTVFLQGPAGVFPVAPSFVLGGAGMTDGVEDVIALDLDGDGDLDLATANRTGNTIALFFQSAAGVFPASPDALLGGGASALGTRGLAGADLDGDGDLDLVSANSGGDDLTVFFQTAPGVFPVDSDLTLTGASLIGPRVVVARDVDRDGDPDLVCASSDSNDLVLFRQSSPGVFAAAEAHGGVGYTDDPRGLEVADVDADGDPDLVGAFFGLNRLGVFFGSH